MSSLKSVSNLVFYVKDINASADFYEALGFRAGKREADFTSVYLNWFSIEFHPLTKTSANDYEGYAYISVEGIDDFYQELVGRGLKPADEPHATPTGRKEFTLLDPDGYKLVFFYKK